jgi:hypothetical protein
MIHFPDAVAPNPAMTPFGHPAIAPFGLLPKTSGGNPPTPRGHRP